MTQDLWAVVEAIAFVIAMICAPTALVLGFRASSSLRSIGALALFVVPILILFGIDGLRKGEGFFGMFSSPTAVEQQPPVSLIDSLTSLHSNELIVLVAFFGTFFVGHALLMRAHRRRIGSDPHHTWRSLLASPYSRFNRVEWLTFGVVLALTFAIPIAANELGLFGARRGSAL